MKTAFFCFLICLSASAQAATKKFFLTGSVAKALIDRMSDLQFPGHDGPGARRMGKIDCQETYSEPGDHASRVVVCKIIPIDKAL